jgi:hypothetical protein
VADDDQHFRFREARNTAVLTCTRVSEGHPVLWVTHDGDGDWQFLCGGDHSGESDDKPLLVCLENVVLRDPSLNELAAMCPLHSATRATPDAPWAIHDDMEDIVRDNIEEHGWHAMQVPGDEEGPGFVYTIGLYRTFKHPEIICLGLPLDVAHEAISTCVDYIRAGGALGDRSEFSDAFVDARCAFRSVLMKHYREHLGYARWFYEGDDFPVVQMLWPDSKGKLPTESGCAEPTVRAQPALWK